MGLVQEFSTLWRSIYTVFAAAVGEFESNTYINHHNPRLTVPLLVLYLFVVTVIMLNLLIALLTNAQEKVRACCCLDVLMALFKSVSKFRTVLSIFTSGQLHLCWKTWSCLCNTHQDVLEM